MYYKIKSDLSGVLKLTEFLIIVGLKDIMPVMMFEHVEYPLEYLRCWQYWFELVSDAIKLHIVCFNLYFEI